MKTLKRIQSMLLAFCLVLSGCLLTPDYGVVKAEAATIDEWNGTTWTDDDGNGIYNVEIDSAQKLVAFSELVSDNHGAQCNATLTCDIDMADANLDENDWVPIGGTSGSTAYYGTFDGQHFRIKNLKVSTTGNFVGLFGKVGQAGQTTTIQNVILDNTCSFSSADGYVGMIAQITSAIGYVYVKNCGNEANMTGLQAVGGIVGHVNANPSKNNRVRIMNCYNTGIITAGSSGLGAAGIVGSNVVANKVSVFNCYNAGSINGGTIGDIWTDVSPVYVEGCYGLSPSTTEATKVTELTEDMLDDPAGSGWLDALNNFTATASANYESVEWALSDKYDHPVFAASIRVVYVAEVDGTKYETFKEAFDAVKDADVKTITLVDKVKVTDPTLLLMDGVTLDLAGYELNMGTSYLVAFDGTKIVDGSSAKCGLLKVADGKFILPENNEQMPVWNGTGYKFAGVGMELANVITESDTISFMLRPSFVGVEESLVAGGQAGAKVRAGVRLEWTTGSEEEGTLANHVQDCYYSDAFHDKVYNAESKTGFSFAVSGLTGFDNMTATPMVVSDLGVLFSTALETE